MHLFSCKIIFVKCQTLWKFTKLDVYCEVNCSLEVQKYKYKIEKLKVILGDAP